MNNIYCVFLASVAVIGVLSESTSAFKIDSTVSLINEHMISMAVSEKSKIEAYKKNDISLLALDHDYLSSIIDKTIVKNLANIDYNIYYYYYDSVSLNSCSIGQFECNSVQIKMDFHHHGKTYERIVRYEPVKI